MPATEREREREKDPLHGKWQIFSHSSLFPIKQMTSYTKKNNKTIGHNKNRQYQNPDHISEKPAVWCVPIQPDLSEENQTVLSGFTHCVAQ